MTMYNAGLISGYLMSSVISSINQLLLLHARQLWSMER